MTVPWPDRLGSAPHTAALIGLGGCARKSRSSHLQPLTRQPGDASADEEAGVQPARGCGAALSPHSRGIRTMLVGQGGMRNQGERCSVVSRRGRGGRRQRTTQAASNVGQVGMEACCGCEEVEHDLNKSERLVAVGEVPGGGEELRI
jgi:hypothetical protein